MKQLVSRRNVLAAMPVVAGLVGLCHGEGDDKTGFVTIVALPPLPDGLFVDLGGGISGTLRHGSLFGPLGLQEGQRTLTVRRQPEDKTYALAMKGGDKFLLVLLKDQKEGILFKRINLPKEVEGKQVMRLPGTGEAVWKLGKEKLEVGGKPVPTKENLKVTTEDGKTVVEYVASENGLYLLMPGAAADSVAVVMIP